MDTKDLQCFTACYEERSIHKAARQLFITPQGLSKTIKNLEKEFSTQLFTRTSSGLEPTESGRLLYEQSTELLMKFEEIRMSIKRLQDAKQMLRIGYSCGALHVLPRKLLDNFREDYHGIPIEWEEGLNDEIKQKVEAGKLDFAFVIGRTAFSKIVENEVFSTRLYAFVPKDHPLYDHETIRIEDLKGEPIITLNEKFQCHFSLLQRCKDFGFDPNIVINTMDSRLIYKFTRENMGIGVDVIYHDHRKDSDVRCIEIEDSIPWKIYAICRESKRQKGILNEIFDQIL